MIRGRYGTMVKRLFLILPMIIALHTAFAANIPPRKITEVKVNEMGKSEDESKNVTEGCRAFKISANEVKDFFSGSYPVPLMFNTHERYSPCYAKGTIAFSDNTRGKWKIASSGGGTLLWDTGDVVTLFYNDYKWSDPFEGTYHSDDGKDYE
ncbi:Uncharacterised protein [Serratia rubidaea]|nr:Uncharacterised protein [Serratia rubidaea]